MGLDIVISFTGADTDGHILRTGIQHGICPLLNLQLTEDPVLCINLVIPAFFLISNVLPFPLKMFDTFALLTTQQSDTEIFEDDSAKS